MKLLNNAQLYLRELSGIKAQVHSIINYDRTATIELVTGYINEPRFYARRAIDNVRAMMKEAGF